MITTTTKTIKIHTSETELRKSFYENYMELLKDTMNEEDPGFFETEIHRLSDAISSTHKHGFTHLFKDGYTMMILPPKQFDFVDEWFNKPGSASEDLEIVITKEDGSVEVVTHDQMSY